MHVSGYNSTIVHLATAAIKRAMLLAAVLLILFQLSPAASGNKVTIPDVHIGTIEGKGSTTYVQVRCVSSDSSAEVQWFSTDITEGTPPVPVVSTPDNDVLEIDLHNLSATNLIDYHCIANNSFGAARTVPFRAYRPPSQVEDIVEVPVVAGQVVVLSCNPTRFFPEPNVRWFVRNTIGSTFLHEDPIIPIRCSDKYRTINGGRDLVIRDITANDVYSLFINGSISNDITNNILLASQIYSCAAFYTRLNTYAWYYIYPRYKLKILDSLPGGYLYHMPRNKVILSNETSQLYSFFYIAISSDEPLGVVSYPGSNHNSTMRVTYDGLPSLLLDQLSVTYDGLPSELLDELSVTLALKNESGVLNGSEVTTNITIIDPLKILPTTPRGIIYVTVGESVTFNCTASGTDVLVTWYQNASEILNYNESLFTIENAVFEDSSVYQCIWYSEAQDLYEQATWGLVVSLPMMINDYNITTTSTPKEAVDTSSVIAIVIPSLIVGLLLLVVLCLVVFMVRTRRLQKHHRKNWKLGQGVNDYVRTRLFSGGRKRSVVKPEYLPHLSSIIVLESDLRLLDNIGQGEFGVVYKAHMLSSKTSCNEGALVAVKTLKGTFSDESVNELIEECLKMKEFQHPNVMNLLGVCLDAGPAPYLILPYMAHGNLLSYLKNNRDKLTLSETCDKNAEEVSSVTIKLISMCLQVAKGMEYLAIQKLVHRDLAARNCMIDETGIIKVADFGLSKSVYDQLYFRQNASDNVKLPIKWLAIESIEDGVFSEKTDVWAFGVTCWEIFSGGKVPYGGLFPLSIPKLLKDGERMEQPDNAACSDYVYKTLMEQCWHGNPDKRPTFSQLQNEISLTLTSMAGYLEFSTINLTVTEDTPV